MRRHFYFVLHLLVGSLASFNQVSAAATDAPRSNGSTALSLDLSPGSTSAHASAPLSGAVFIERPPPPSPLTDDIVIHRETRPFWRRDPVRLRQIRDERAIAVSVRRADEKAGLIFILNGAGDVSRDCAFSYAVAQQFERLPEASRRFEKVTSDASRHQLFMIAQAFGLHEPLLFHIELRPAGAHREGVRNQDSTELDDQIRFEVQWGKFKGMTGAINFEPIDLNKCEISIYAVHSSASSPLPQSLMGFVLEVVVQQVAESLRATIEKLPASSIRQYQEQRFRRPELTLSRALAAQHIPMQMLMPVVVDAPMVLEPALTGQRVPSAPATFSGARPVPARPKNPQTP